MSYSFVDEATTQEPSAGFQPTSQGPGVGFSFLDEEPPIQNVPTQEKGTLETAADIVSGAAFRMAQGVNESLGAINGAFGMENGIYTEGAAYWDKKAKEAGSTGLPAQIYQGIGAAPAGVAEFIAGPVYAGAKGAAEGYREGGVVGALEKATVETAKRYGLGKIFHGIENTAISGLPKAAAMGGTMGVQTAAEQALSEDGINPQDIAASAITGTLLSVSSGGKPEIIRQQLIKAGAQPEVARDLSGRVQDITSGSGKNRYSFVDENAAKEPTELELAVNYNNAKWETGKRGLMQTPGVSNQVFQERLLGQYRNELETATILAQTPKPAQEVPSDVARKPVTITDPQGNVIDVPLDTRPPESIGSLISETGTGKLTIMQPETPRPGAVEQFTATGSKRGNQDLFEIKLNPSQRRTLEEVRQEISDGQAGQRTGIYNTNEPGSTQVSWGSSFPDYFKNKGYTKNAAITAIDNILSGQGVTANQRIMVEDMHQAKRQQYTNAILGERAKPSEVTAMSLNEGDTLKRNGEQFKVTDVSPDGVTLKDGVVMELNHEQAINYDRGTLKNVEGKQKRVTPENGGNFFDPFSEPDFNSLQNPGQQVESVQPYTKTLFRGTADRDPLHSGGIDEVVVFPKSETGKQPVTARYSMIDEGNNPLVDTGLNVSPGDIIPTVRKIAPSEAGLNVRSADIIGRKPLPDTTTPLDAQAHDAATSPYNSLPEPTPKQIDAGNYKMGHPTLHGLDISIENPAGSTRKGVDETGRQWSTDLNHHYGYLKGTIGKDKDHLDVFIKRGIDQTTAGDKVFVVDQVEPNTRKLDEHKILFGFDSPAAAREGYLSNYDKTGPQRIGAITEVPVEGFKQWLKEGDTRKPFTDFPLTPIFATAISYNIVVYGDIA
jgi:hypothetical protein